MSNPSASVPDSSRRRFAKTLRGSCLRATGLAAALLLALVSACGGDPAQSKNEREVQDYLKGVVAPAMISEINCPDDAPIRPGSTFRCDGLVEGGFYEAQVTIIDEQGRLEIRPLHAVMPVSASETTLGAEAAVQIGRDLQADCGDNLYLVVPVGKVFVCTLTETSTGRTEDIEVKVLNENGVIEWSLKRG